MALGDLWSRTLVYFGIAEEDDDWEDEDGFAAEESLEQSYRERPERPAADAAAPLPRLRRLDGVGGRPADDPAGSRGPSVPRSRDAPADRGGADASSVKVHLVLPRSFNDAQQIADKFKQGIPVILNLQNADTELSKRLIDFASGLTYALNGGMQRVADKVFLLTPRNVEVSAEQRAALLERGGFFNQA